MVSKEWKLDGELAAGERPPANEHARWLVDVELEAAPRVRVMTDGAVVLHFVEDLRRRRHGHG